MSPSVSIVLPVRDAAGTIARAVASIRRQTRTDWELVVVDDGSIDGTREWLRSAAAEDSRLRLLARPADGLVSALNAGLAAARGRYIARMDADDECASERVELQAAWLDEHPEAGLVSCLVRYGGERAAGSGYALHVDWLNSLRSHEDVALNRFVESPVAHPSVMFRRELPARHGAYRAGPFPEDYELWLRWIDAGVRAGKVPRELLTWHDSPRRLSRRDARYDPEAFYRTKAEYLAKELRRAGCREVLVWGAGRPTRRRVAHLEAHGIGIAGFVDVDAKKIGQRIGGRTVRSPAELPEPGGSMVLGYVGTRGARELIRADLRGRGYREGVHFFMCA